MIADGSPSDFGKAPLPKCKTPAAPKKPMCNVCGAKTTHWRLFNGDYKLADDQRQHPGNRYIPHVCQTSADGFGDCE